MVSAYSSRSHSRMVGEVTNRLMIGESPGFSLRNEGGLGMPGGSSGMAAAIAVSTSTVAPSMSRLRSNCRVIDERALAAVGGHRVQAGDAGELPLERSRYRRGHGVGIGAGQAGAYRDGGIVHLRQIADRQRAVGDHAEQRDRSHEQAGGDRPPDKSLGNVHAGIPPPPLVPLAHGGATPSFYRRGVRPSSPRDFRLAGCAWSGAGLRLGFAPSGAGAAAALSATAAASVAHRNLNIRVVRRQAQLALGDHDIAGVDARTGSPGPDRRAGRW